MNRKTIVHKFIPTVLLLYILTSCSNSTPRGQLIDWERIAYENGHSYFDLKKNITLKYTEVNNNYRNLSERIETDLCTDQTTEEIELMDVIIDKHTQSFSDPIDASKPDEYEFSYLEFEKYIKRNGKLKFFQAKEMVSISENHRPSALSCGLNSLLPSRCRWKSGLVQGIIADKLRELVKSPVLLRNWWRPECYNKKVKGSKKSDHIQARGFDLDFSSAKNRAKAQAFICSFYKKNAPISLQVGIGCRSLHIGIGSPKRKKNYPKDGSRFWTYNSLQNCPLKRLKEDDCWTLGKDKKLHIHNQQGGSNIL